MFFINKKFYQLNNYFFFTELNYLINKDIINGSVFNENSEFFFNFNTNIGHTVYNNFSMKKSNELDSSSSNLDEENFQKEDFLQLNVSWILKNDLKKFIYLKTSSFVSFFLSNNIDIPICFKRSKSLNFKVFELPLLKFFNYIMKQGLREKTIKNFFYFLSNQKNPFNAKFNWINDEQLKINNELLSETFFLSNFIRNFNLSIQNLNPSLVKLLYLSFVFNQFSFRINDVDEDAELKLDKEAFFKTYFLNLFKKPNIVFAYFVHNVDKNVKKFSRGKSGKYVFVWKYIAPYKRIFLAMRLFSKDLKFKNEKRLYKNFLNTISILEKNYNESFLGKFKKYTHNFVFKNFKKTSMISLKTAKKK